MKNALIAFTLILLASCNSDDAAVDYSAQNEEEIQEYLTINNLTAQKSASGLHYIIEEAGTGLQPTINDRVKVVYKGYFTNGDIFDQSDSEGTSFADLLQVISGWAEGITYFKEGGSGKLFIPAHLGYGGNTRGTIPGGSVLIFDIELIYVNYKTENEQQIQDYITENNLTTQQSNTGLHYIIDTQGEGAQPTETDNVTIDYKGYFINGTTFDENPSINFNLQNVISGFAEGLTYFKEGGSGTLIIPAHLAYGNYGTGDILGGSVILFDINLISVN